MILVILSCDSFSAKRKISMKVYMLGSADLMWTAILKSGKEKCEKLYKKKDKPVITKNLCDNQISQSSYII